MAKPKQIAKALGLRIIAVEIDAGRSIHVGGPVEVEHKTFDLPVSASLAEWLEKQVEWGGRTITGVEVLRENLE